MVSTTPSTSSDGIQVLADALDGVQQLADAFQREVLGLHGDEYRVGGDQGVEREQVQRRRAVQDDEPIAGADASSAWRRRNSRGSSATSSRLAPIRFLCDGTR